MNPLRVSILAGICLPIISHDILHPSLMLDPVKQRVFHKSKRDAMRVLTCEDHPASTVHKTSNANKFVKDLVMETTSEYSPAWFYFNPLLGMIRSFCIKSKHQAYVLEKYQIVKLHDPQEGDLVLNILERDPQCKSRSGKKEKVLIVLHGLVGSAYDEPVIDIVGSAAKRGYNCIVINHHPREGDTNFRMMDLSDDKYINEVLTYAKSRYGKSDIYMLGISMGGN